MHSGAKWVPPTRWKERDSGKSAKRHVRQLEIARSGGGEENVRKRISLSAATSRKIMGSKENPEFPVETGGCKLAALEAEALKKL